MVSRNGKVIYYNKFEEINLSITCFCKPKSMFNSKHSHYRYNILDKCFRRRERPLGFQELLDEVNESIAELSRGEGISVRTLRDDI